MLTPFTLPGYTVRPLTQPDEASLQALLERCADYCQLITGAPPKPSAAAALLVDLPPGKTLADKCVLGLEIGVELIGVLDTVRDYPQPAEWALGLLLLDPRYRSHGLGRQVYQRYEAWAAQAGARHIRLGVCEQNGRAYQFWQRLAFDTVEKQPPQHFGALDNVVILMRRATGI